MPGYDVSGSNDAIAAVLGHPDLPDTLDGRIIGGEDRGHGDIIRL
jgi:hypothetical protein